MKTDLYTKVMLAAIVLLLGAIALRPLAVQAQAGKDLYIEPSYTTLRKPDGSAQLRGKVVIDMQTGDVWGFPTMMDLPYPVDVAKSEPPVSNPMYLGKFNFDGMKR
jgi:hypothetical protein